MDGGGTDRLKFVAGLGNPGRRYARTRHNAGFRVVDELARRWQSGEGRHAFDGVVYDARPSRGRARARVRLLAPQTYMNRSGRAVQQLLAFHKADAADVLVVLDDMALPLGRLRIRGQGSAGGHNGLADVLACLGRDDVPRLRIGIGAAPGQMDPADYVLQAFSADEEETIESAVVEAADAAEDWVFHGLAFVMDRYNRKS